METKINSLEVYFQLSCILFLFGDLLLLLITNFLFQFLSLFLSKSGFLLSLLTLLLLDLVKFTKSLERDGFRLNSDLIRFLTIWYGLQIQALVITFIFLIKLYININAAIREFKLSSEVIERSRVIVLNGF